MNRNLNGPISAESNFNKSIKVHNEMYQSERKINIDGDIRMTSSFLGDECVDDVI